MINPTPHVNNVFREKNWKILKRYIWSEYHGMYNKCYDKKDTCVIAPIMFYETKTNNPIKLYRVLSCVLYYGI